MHLFILNFKSNSISLYNLRLLNVIKFNETKCAIFLDFSPILFWFCLLHCLKQKYASRRTRPPSTRGPSSNVHPTSKPAASSSHRPSTFSSSTSTRSSNITLNAKRTSAPPPIRGSGGIPKSRVNRSSHHHSQNGEYAVEYPVDYTLVKKMVADNAAAAGQPLFMPYMGTYYYNGVPSYSNMDPSSLKEAIRKQM